MPSANVNFVDQMSLIQEFQLINDSTWFLSKDKFVVNLSAFGKKKMGVIGRKTTTYKNIVYNDSSVTRELDKNKITGRSVVCRQCPEPAGLFLGGEAA